jgi:multimeric flavodoxin WrbA
MYIAAFNGSPRKGGNTEFFVDTALKPLREAGHECERIDFFRGIDGGCSACGGCREEGVERCTEYDDQLGEYLQKMYRAAAIIIASPTYFSDLNAETKALIDRAGYVARGSGNPLARKIGAGIAVARRSGEVHSLMSINQFFLINEMIVPGSSYWNVALARDLGDGQKDEEGIRTMHRLGENIAWLLERLHGQQQ